jgi:hypothetical protein
MEPYKPRSIARSGVNALFLQPFVSARLCDSCRFRQIAKPFSTKLANMRATAGKIKGHIGRDDLTVTGARIKVTADQP